VGATGIVYFTDNIDFSVRRLQPYTSLAVVNAASYVSGPIAPGEIVVVYGSNLGPAQLAVAAPDGAGLFEPRFGGTDVTINGVPAPVIYTSAHQAAAIVPFATGGASAEVVVSYQGQPAATAVPVQTSSPGVFTANSSGYGQAAALNTDGTPNGPASPAHAGDVIVLYLTRGGQTTPAGTDGALASQPLPQPNAMVTVTVGGLRAQVQYAGAAPGEVSGLMQINIQLPAGVTTGDTVPVSIALGTVVSQPGVTLAIR
jgi:trimeric autotransporter adhesin